MQRHTHAHLPSPRSAPPPIRALSLTTAIRERILLHLLDAAPNEGVGLLAVDPMLTAGGTAIARRFFPGTNLDASPTRYTMDPIEVLAAIRDIEAGGMRLGAIVHSHLTSPATPSATDLREAFYPDAVMLIATFATHPAELRAWRIDHEDDLQMVRSVRLEIVQPHR